MSASNSTSPPLLLDDPSRGRSVVIIYWVFTTVSGIVLLARFWARGIRKTTGFDDLLALLCWLNLLAIAIMLTLLNNIGGFGHLALIPPQQLPQVLKILWATQPFGIMGIVPGKVAVAFTILQVRGSTASRLFRWTLHALSILTLATAIPTLLLQFLQCDPPRALWTPGLQSTCLNPSIQANYVVFSGGWNALFDFALASIPATFIFKLNMSLRRRILISMLLGLSLFTGIAASIKIDKLKELGARSDITCTEMFFVIVLGSAPLIKPLWDKLFKKDEDQSSPSANFSSRMRTTKRLYQRQASIQSATEPNLLPQKKSNSIAEMYEMNRMEIVA